MRVSIRFFALLIFTSLAWAQTVPWIGGEKLVYQLGWQGLAVGRLYLNVDSHEGGWRYRLKLEPEGLAALGGYGLEAESLVDGNFYTERFWKNLTEPLKGTTKLVFQRSDPAGGSAKISYPDGKQGNWQTLSPQVLDDLSLIYYVRIRPEVRQINAVDYPSLAQGQLQSLGKSADGLLGYRFERDGLLFEIWYRPDARRTPVRVIFGRDFGRLEATLIDGR